MKPNELMIGDWVLYDGKPIQVDEIFGDGINADYCGGEIMGLINEDELLPIPITAEILEKNGFIFKDVAHNAYRGLWICNLGGCNNIYIQFTDKIAIEIHNEISRKDDNGRADLVTFCRDWCEVLYVHELQHALKLCGIDKTIEV